MADTKTFQKFPSSEFPTIYCTKLIVKPSTTSLKWDPSKKAHDIFILGCVDTAKTVVVGKENGILSNTGMTIGSDMKAWYYDINELTQLHVGLALANKNLNTTDGALVNQLVAVSNGDRVRFQLTTGGTFSIRHETGGGDSVITKFYNLSPHVGQIVYAWASTTSQNTMSVKIMDECDFITTVDPTGSVRMTGTNNDIVDFSIEDIVENDGGGGSVSGDSSITNIFNDSKVEVENSGDIFLKGGISYKCENITDPVTSVTLGVDQFAVVISNATVLSVFLPAATGNDCQYYSVTRNYPLQGGEIWQTPVLSVFANGLDTIEGESSVGLPVDSNIQLMSDGLTTWRIM